MVSLCVYVRSSSDRHLFAVREQPHVRGAAVALPQWGAANTDIFGPAATLRSPEASRATGRQNTYLQVNLLHKDSGAAHPRSAKWGDWYHNENRNGPRILDLDILLYGAWVVDEGELLRIPHPRLSERDFVLRSWVACTA
jgi:hypothetical protein